ncbi:hypothetical protein J690_1270 [Acinetobacter sp. 742879]|uniref:hypothetical protein n=1 Tax=Acinetobacter sp. 742879 TaxID=1310791 RepID=UPI00044DC562|nr:hypothetical protein [Acinetobacter sp. 742879]EXS29283.1 hypothetical protein J690_1270 [Acinetobacter sp. 742879]
MSLVFKSDKTSIYNFGTWKSISVTAEDAFNIYKQRVLADGGVIQDEAATLIAFKFLIDNGLYGAARTWVSSKFGLKLEGNAVVKAYAIDGEDLIAQLYGTGVYPTLTANGIKFNNLRNDVVNGGIFTTEKKIGFKGKGTVVGLQIYSQIPSTPTQMIHAGITLHNEQNNVSPLFFVLTASNGTFLTLRRQTGTANQNSTVSTTYVNIDMNMTTDLNNRFVFRTSEILTTGEGYRNGQLVTNPLMNPANFDSFYAYLDFGGVNYHSAGAPKRAFSEITAKHFFLFDDMNNERALALSHMNI